MGAPRAYKGARSRVSIGSPAKRVSVLPSSSPKNAAVSSMTGFASQEGGDGVMTWRWELRSVNGRGLDLRTRVPGGYEALEAAARAAIPRHLTRGNVQISLAVDRSLTPVAVKLNEAVLEQVTDLARRLGDRFGTKPRPDGLLALRGVLETIEEKEDPALREDREAAMLEGLESALEQLAEVRRVEGARLHEAALELLQRIEALTVEAVRTAAAQPEALRARLKEQLELLLQTSPALPEERLAQEAALLATKADVREELERLAAHVEAARDQLRGGGAIGRRLDFLCQELNREANTLCSKSSDLALTRVGLEIKATIDQLREQVQNIE